jgi:hypothetical protein
MKPADPGEAEFVLHACLSRMRREISRDRLYVIENEAVKPGTSFYTAILLTCFGLSHNLKPNYDLSVIHLIEEDL